MITNPNCKINLGLQVVRRRDDGYHDLQTVFVPVPLCDKLEIIPSERFSFAQTGIDICCNPEDNIVVKAFRLMQRECGSRLSNVEINLHKNIPFGAGLGGGSSDAAFALRMLNDIFDLGFDSGRLCLLASKLGADCAFFIDNVPAYATGIGDKLTPLGFNPLEGYKLVLVKPGESVSTAEAYRGVTPREKQNKPCPDLSLLLAQPVGSWKDTVANDFESSVFKSHPQLSTLKTDLYTAGALYASMSGSGSTFYGLFEKNANVNIVHNNNIENIYTFNL